jgi:hypothetical protein
MPIRAEQDAVIFRPGAEVFALIADPAKESLWNPSVLKTERVSGPPGAAGSVYRETHHLMYRKNTMVFEVVRNDPGREFGIKTSSGGPLQIASYTLDPHPDGVRVTLTTDVFLPAILLFAAPLLRRMARKQAGRSLSRLKVFLERSNPVE